MDSSNPSKLDAIVKDMKKLNDKQLDTIATLVKDLIKKEHNSGGALRPSALLYVVSSSPRNSSHRELNRVN